MFKWCTSLESIVIPSTVECIYSSDFENCTSLTTVTINSQILYHIFDQAFYNCTKLKTVNIVNATTYFGKVHENAFMNIAQGSVINVKSSYKSAFIAGTNYDSTLTSIVIK